MSIVTRFRYNELFMLYGNDVMMILSLGEASGNFWLWILKGRPRLYIHVQLTFFVYLERFRSYSTFFIWLGFPYWGRNFGGLGAKWPPKRQNREKLLLGRHFFTPNCDFWAIVREIISIRLACADAQEKKGGRKKSHKKCIFHVCVERLLAGGFQPNLASVFVSLMLSNLQSFIVINPEV